MLHIYVYIYVESVSINSLCYIETPMICDFIHQIYCTGNHTNTYKILLFDRIKSDKGVM